MMAEEAIKIKIAISNTKIRMTIYKIGGHPYLFLILSGGGHFNAEAIVY